jgi:hypothetical protein
MYLNNILIYSKDLLKTLSIYNKGFLTVIKHKIVSKLKKV